MYYYRFQNETACSPLPDLPLPPAPPALPRVYLLRRDAQLNRWTFPVEYAGQLTAEQEDVRLLDPDRLPSGPDLPELLEDSIRQRLLWAVNIDAPQWREPFTGLPTGKKSVHLLAAGDVGVTLLMALRLLGGDSISSLGVFDLNQNAAARAEAELGQMAWPSDPEALPEVKVLTPEELFDCDVFLFAASRSVPAVESAVADVRMAQLEANRVIVEQYARRAREAHFRGLFIVLSDPVDPLCRASWLASNRDNSGAWDGLGLFPEQIQGFGLGVMNARAAYFAKRDPRFHSYLQEGRCYGPHGQGLVVANARSDYNDALSRELTEQVLGANLAIRALGYKPYLAPAVSSGAMQLLLTLRGEYHYGSVFLGGIWFGVRSIYEQRGLRAETAPLPDPLFRRLQETEELLRSIS